MIEGLDGAEGITAQMHQTAEMAVTKLALQITQVIPAWLPWVALAVYTVGMLGVVYIMGHSVITRGIREWIAGPVSARCPTCGDATEARFADGFECMGDKKEHAPVPFQLVNPPAWRLWPVTLLECPACLGFWLGLFAGWEIGPFIPVVSNGLVICIAACYTSGAMFVLGRTTGLMPLPKE